MPGEGTTTATSSEPASNHDPSATALPRSIPTTLPESGKIGADPPAVIPDDGTEEVGTLEWAQVIELQAFSERKVWIEEKTRVNICSILPTISSRPRLNHGGVFSSYWNKCHQ